MKQILFIFLMAVLCHHHSTKAQTISFKLTVKEDGKYYFADPQDNKIIKLGEWEKAEEFNWLDLAKVEANGVKYLLDTLGNTYPVAYNLQDLTPNITALDLSSKHWGIFPTSLFQQKQLKILLLSNCKLSQIPDSIGLLGGLEVLDLSWNKFNLPENITKLTGLQTLVLNNNQLNTLPEDFARLTNLQTLHLSNNQLNALPECITQLNKLQKLYLNNSQLVELPESIGKLTNLQILSLLNNQLNTLPESIGKLSNLQTLYLNHNQLSNLPESIGKLSKLQSLELENNPLNNLPKSIAQLNKLHILNLKQTPAPPPYNERVYDKKLKSFLEKLNKGEIKFGQ